MIIPIEKDHLLSKNYEFQTCVVSGGEKKIETRRINIH